ncbi:hypothetical protein [Streptomyces sp. NPDC003327]
MIRTTLRVPAVLMTVVIGTAGAVSCSADPTDRTGRTDGPARPTATAAPRTGPSKTAWTPPPAADLPRRAVADKRPGLAAAGTMATGYTGKEFLTGLAERWKLKLDEPVEQEMPDGKKRTYVNGRGGNGMTVSAGYADHKDMSSLVCRTGTNHSAALAFLTACTGLDVAGIDHAKVSSWLERAKRETDSLYAKKVAETKNEKEYVVSGALASGPVVMVLHRAYDKYSLRILGDATS